MATTTKHTTAVKTHEQEAIAHGSAQVGLGVILVLSALIGVWGVACLLSGIAQYGITGMIKGWLSAIMGA